MFQALRDVSLALTCLLSLGGTCGRRGTLNRQSSLTARCRGGSRESRSSDWSQAESTSSSSLRLIVARASRLPRTYRRYSSALSERNDH